MLDVRNPIEEAIKGYTMGRNDIAQRQEMQIQQQTAAMQQQAFADQQTALAEQRAVAAKEQEKAAAFQQDLMISRDAIENKTWTPEMANALKLKYAGNFDEQAAVVAAMQEPMQAETRKYNISVVVPALMGDIETTLKNVDERIAAAEASGNAAEVQAQKAFRQAIMADPYGAALGLTLTSNASGLFSDELMKNILDKTQTKAAEAASPLGKISQDVDKGILPKEVLDSAIKLDRMNAEGGLTLKDKVAEEARLRGEFNKRTEDLTNAERYHSMIVTSAADGTGPGDIALITSFMKMLDPGSVVRETEFATAQNAGGLLAGLGSMLTKVKTGELLLPEERVKYRELSKQFLDAARVREQGVQKSYQSIVDNYGLNPINVFGVQADNAPPSPPETPTTPPAPIVGGAGASLDFSAMTKADLVAVDVMSLTSDQKAAMLKRFAEVNAGP